MAEIDSLVVAHGIGGQLYSKSVFSKLSTLVDNGSFLYRKL